MHLVDEEIVDFFQQDDIFDLVQEEPFKKKAKLHETSHQRVIRQHEALKTDRKRTSERKRQTKTVTAYEWASRNLGQGLRAEGPRVLLCTLPV